MSIDENTFYRGVTERLFAPRKFEVSLHETFLFIKKFFPADRLNLHLYDPEMNAIRTIAVATSEDAQKINTVLPLDTRGIEYFRDPKTPEAQLIVRGEDHPIVAAIVRYSGRPYDYSVMALHLRNETGMFAMVSVLLKREANTSRQLKLFSVLKTPFAWIIGALSRYDEASHPKPRLDGPGRTGRQQASTITEKEIIGSGLKHVLEMARQIAMYDSPVILLGETGVGKEMIARLIHNMSNRRNGPFVPVNCGAIPDTLIDSELFGYEKGAFTGATSSKKGVFESADRGTVFLDEVAELPLNAQVRMLRVLQEKRIQLVGSMTPVDVDIRVIAATHGDLDQMIHSGKFRSDLWFRLHVFTIMIPPLRERKEDIPALVAYFIKKKSKRMGIPAPFPASAESLLPLFSYDWPGNVRELENIVERALILSRGNPLAFQSILRRDETETIPEPVLKPTGNLNLDHMVIGHIREVLKLTGGKINGPGGAAEKLGIHPATLRSRMTKLGIPFGKGTY